MSTPLTPTPNPNFPPPNPDAPQPEREPVSYTHLTLPTIYSV